MVRRYSTITGSTVSEKLFGARKALEYLVSLHNNGKWHLLYNEETFTLVLCRAKREFLNWKYLHDDFARLGASAEPRL